MDLSTIPVTTLPQFENLADEYRQFLIDCEQQKIPRPLQVRLAVMNAGFFRTLMDLQGQCANLKKANLKDVPPTEYGLPLEFDKERLKTDLDTFSSYIKLCNLPISPRNENRPIISTCNIARELSREVLNLAGHIIAKPGEPPYRPVYGSKKDVVEHFSKETLQTKLMDENRLANVMLDSASNADSLAHVYKMNKYQLTKLGRFTFEHTRPTFPLNLLLNSYKYQINNAFRLIQSQVSLADVA